MTEKKISNAPAPFTPIRGMSVGLSQKSSHKTEVNQVHASSPPDWSCWTVSQRVTLDQAATLSLNIDPDSLQPKAQGFITSACFADSTIGFAFNKRLNALNRKFTKTNIKLSEVATYAVREAKWAGLPPELVAMVVSESSAAPVQRHATAASGDPAPLPTVPNWKMQVQAEATALCLTLQKSGSNPTKHSIIESMAKWCRDNKVKTNGNIFPSEGYLRTHVLGGRHWDVPR
jgi:hypothetical protein